MADILLLYSTTDGHTKLICSRLKAVIEEQDHRVTVCSIDDEHEVDIACFDKIVLGASIRYGKHSSSVYAFIKSNREILENRPNAFFSVNVVARKPEKKTAQTNPYVRKFLREIPWKPRIVTVFAGKIDYPRYRFWDRQIIRFIMWMTKGPTDPKSIVEFTNWKEVEAFGKVVSDM